MVLEKNTSSVMESCPNFLDSYPPVDEDCDFLHVAVGIVRDNQGRYLISKRQAHQEHSECWEFAGGKIDSGETVKEGLCRELLEELGIIPVVIEPFLYVDHIYETFSAVKLYFCLVTEFKGEPKGAEGQMIRWITEDEFSDYVFPAASYSVIEKLKVCNKPT